MAEEDNELLDWGNEDDVVSLGDEEEAYSYDEQETSQNGTSNTQSVSNAAPMPQKSISPLHPTDNTSTDQKLKETSAPQSSAPSPVASKNQKPTGNQQSPPKTTVLPRMTHALPPKPVVTNVTYNLRPSHPSIVEATAMSTRSKKAGSATHSKNGSSQENDEPLPPHWEARQSRNGAGTYYYNTQTFQSQWNRPSSRTNRSAEVDTFIPAYRSGSPPILSHDDRHYRPSDDGKYSSNSGRRFDPNIDEQEPRYDRSSHTSANARSPTQGRERSRSPTPPPQPRSRGNRRPSRMRANAKGSGAQKELRDPDFPDLSDTNDRHWVPAQSATTTSTDRPKDSRRRQERSQDRPADDRVLDSGRDNPSKPPLHRVDSDRGYSRDRDRAYPQREYSPSGIPAPRPSSPPPQDDRVMTANRYYPAAEGQRREPVEARRRSPPPVDITAPVPGHAHRMRNSRFDRLGSTPGMEKSNLPSNPTVEGINDSRREEATPTYQRRGEEDRRYEDIVPQDSYRGYAPEPFAPIRSESPKEPERVWIPGPHGDRGKASPRPEQSASNTRKRPPLPPQDAEYRGIIKSKPLIYREPSNQQLRDSVSSPQTYEMPGKHATDSPLPPRDYALRDSRDNGFGRAGSTGRSIAPVVYEREYERGKPGDRLRRRDEHEGDRVYDVPLDLPPMPANESRRASIGYPERDPPLKPRAMKGSESASSNAHPPSGPSGSSTPANYSAAPAPRYERSPPPHLPPSENRREYDMRPSVWQERQSDDQATLYTQGERGSRARDYHGGKIPVTSNSNSIPIGSRRTFSTSESSNNEYPPNPPNERYNRSYAPDDLPPRPPRNYGDEYPSPFPEPEPVVGAYTRSRPATDSYRPVPDDDRDYGRRGENEPMSRNKPSIQSQGLTKQHQGRFSSTRNPRADPPSEVTASAKSWPQNHYDASRGRYAEDLNPRGPTPPPISREPSYTSPNWEHTPAAYHEPPFRFPIYPEPTGYREPPAEETRAGMDIPPGRQPPRNHYGGHIPSERPRGRDTKEHDTLEHPSVRDGDQRDHPYSPSNARRTTATPDLARSNNNERSVQGKRGGAPPASRPSLSFEDDSRGHRPRMLNERISGFPESHGRKQPPPSYPASSYSGKPELFDVRAREPIVSRQDEYAARTTKTFEERIELPEKPSGSLISRISQESANGAPVQSLRDRVQVPTKRDRDDMVRDTHFTDVSFETDDPRKSRKRRRARRNGPP